MNTLFREVVRQHTQETAIIFGNQKLTYGELDRLSDAIAQLILESGHKPADCPFVGLYSSRSLYTIPMMIGIWKAGFAYVPMDPKYSSERIGYILDDCKLRLILTDCSAPVADYPQAQWLSIDADSMPCEIRGYGGTEVRGYGGTEVRGYEVRGARYEVRE
jgi:non-ribosomal peptide synthetase component F